MQMRALGGDDATALHELDQRCFPPGIAYSRGEIDAALGARDGFHRGAFVQGALAGFILTAPTRSGAGHVITVDVDARQRRAGIGRALLLAAEAHYRERAARAMRLEVAVNNAPALAFYAGLGYRVVRALPGYYARDLDGLRLEKSLPG
ncbi:MAG: GNAT family N-acetyltransferase [Terriglobales bacterium]